jgi:hypothetical protein
MVPGKPRSRTIWTKVEIVVTQCRGIDAEFTHQTQLCSLRRKQRVKKIPHGKVTSVKNKNIV